MIAQKEAPGLMLESLAPQKRAQFFDYFQMEYADDPHRYWTIGNLRDRDLDEDLLFAVITGYEGKSVQRAYYATRYEDDSIFKQFPTVSQLYFVNGELKQITQTADRGAWHNREIVVDFDSGDGGFRISGSFHRGTPGSDISVADREDSLNLYFNSQGDVRSMYSLFHGTLEEGKSSRLNLTAEQISRITAKPTFFPPAFGDGVFQLVKVDGQIKMTLIKDGVVVDESVFPAHVDIEEVKRKLFPHEEAIPEAEVPALRVKLGTNDVPYTRSIILAHPEMARSDFPLDESGKRVIVDYDEVWRSVDLAGLIGIDIARVLPL